jgi:hypothetical protein
MPTAVLSAVQKVKIRHHLGYLNVAASATFALGVPAAVETMFIIESAMDKVLPEALPEVDRHLGILDGIEQQMLDDLELMAANQVGEISINQKEQAQLTQFYNRWVDSLANVLGSMRNPYDKRLPQNSGAGGGLNARVMG